ncbi:hypothetical protein ZWY2020_010852 [Hordeum vulgare]|nr:hypothetical protein ZWY2020_010852 [Hordeum vulgare]
MVADYIPGATHRRPATSTCSVVSTPEMEEESYRLRTTALLLTAVGPCSGITADKVAEAVEHDQGFPRRDISVAPCFPEDFLLVLSETRRSLPEGTPSEQGNEGPHFPVLIHLDVVKDYTPAEDGDLEWTRIYEHKEWRMGTKDGERRARAAVSEGSSLAARRSEDDGDDGYNGGARRRSKRSGVRSGFWQGIRDSAHCRNTVTRASKPRCYRRHNSSLDTTPLATCLPSVEQ